MLECHCEGGPKGKITLAETIMAEAEGLDVEYVHKFMDTWERHCDVALDRPDYDEWMKKNCH